MSLAEKVLKDFEQLPDDKQIEVIDFIEFLKNKEQKKLENLMNMVIQENKEALEELAKW